MKTLRSQWGLTQEELAALIGVTRGLLSMYESGRRQLPTPASIRLAELYLLLQQPSTSKLHSTALQQRQLEQQTKTAKLLNDRAGKAAMEAARAARVLDNMQQRYEQLSQKMLLVQAALPTAVPGSLQKTALLYMESKLMDAMDRCSPARQAWVAYKRAACIAVEQAALKACRLVKGT
ncbi:helix-turn-helix transcriptional regulator [Niabella sp. CC-SYL272]|uniref:helix-turn-helix domain-containing protein n=1 Tax=Niabella agricola TaxID=2891571 RepID=UPI001F2190BC|nr:helix-turn-helix transcriptional regulator [Niabella agricola]MCF3112068.1 helix-turn-helix transcriptional regulator [Niabella agricola]